MALIPLVRPFRGEHLFVLVASCLCRQGILPLRIGAGAYCRHTTQCNRNLRGAVPRIKANFVSIDGKGFEPSVQVLARKLK
jgi:hypothetical protein